MKDSLHDLNNNNPGNPDKVYKDELNNRGGGLFDTKQESDARDAAKIEKSLSGQGQKMDSVSEKKLTDPQESASVNEREREIQEREKQ